ncbi:MAG TPA: M3 family oligoendopeptidase [Ktedonobacterales bacterium]
MTSFATLPATSAEFRDWPWERIAPYYDELLARPLTQETLAAWLADWTAISALLDEVNNSYTIATTVNTADEEAERGYMRYLDTIQPQAMAAEQRMREKLLASGLEAPEGFAVPLRKLRAGAELYREANIPILSELRKLAIEYEKLAGARTALWEGQELPLPQIYPFLLDPDRSVRERAWRTMAERRIQDTPALTDLWQRMMTLRRQLAANAGFGSYRDYRWRELFRFDYTPDDAKRFQDAIAQVAVPAASKLNERRRQRLGVETLRPWDMEVNTSGKPRLQPYATVAELEERTSAIFSRVDPQFGDYFETMRAEGLLDLESRANKAPGGYSLEYSVRRVPFIFMNGVGAHDDVVTLLHEGGHSFHTFEMAPLPYLQQHAEQTLPMEFAEVASMGMELLATPYLARAEGGFYTEAEAARARIEHLDSIIRFWPYMAMIDTLQHWAYDSEEGADLAACDDYWATLVDRYWPDQDWSGLDEQKRASWHRQGHVFTDPFYYIEYGIAELGAAQVWANALKDQAGAVAAYRRALALGGSATLPELFTAAGVRFAFDAETLRRAIDLMLETIDQLEPVAEG